MTKLKLVTNWVLLTPAPAVLALVVCHDQSTPSVGSFSTISDKIKWKFYTIIFHNIGFFFQILNIN